MHDGIIKLQKQEKKNEALGGKPPSGAVQNENPNLLNGGRHATTEKYPMNPKYQSSPGTENLPKGSTSRI